MHLYFISPHFFLFYLQGRAKISTKRKPPTRKSVISTEIFEDIPDIAAVTESNNADEKKSEVPAKQIENINFVNHIGAPKETGIPNSTSSTEHVKSVTKEIPSSPEVKIKRADPFQPDKTKISLFNHSDGDDDDDDLFGSTSKSQNKVTKKISTSNTNDKTPINVAATNNSLSNSDQVLKEPIIESSKSRSQNQDHIEKLMKEKSTPQANVKSIAKAAIPELRNISNNKLFANPPNKIKEKNSSLFGDDDSDDDDLFVSLKKTKNNNNKDVARNDSLFNDNQSDDDNDLFKSASKGKKTF